MAKGNTIKALLSIAGNIDPSLDKAINTAQKKFGGVNSLIKASGIAFTAAAGSAVAFGAAAVKSSMEFESQMAMVSTLLTGTSEEIKKRNDELGKESLAISSKLGVPYEELTNTVYNTISAFGDLGDDVTKIAELSAKSAKAGGASATEALNLLSAVTKAYNDTSYEAQERVADLAFMTVNLGQTTYPELATAITKVTSLSNTMGVSQEELFGVFATLTGVTGNASEVATQYKAALSGLMVPTQSMKDVIGQLGYTSGQAMIQEMGLQRTLETLKIAVGDDELAFSNLFGSVEAKGAVLAMVGAQAENLTQKTAAMNNAAGATETAYARTANTLTSKIQIIKTTISNFATSIGNRLLPTVTDIATLFGDKLPGILEQLEPIMLNAGSLFSGLAQGIVKIGEVAIPVFGKLINAVGFVGNNFETVAAVATPLVAGLIAYKTTMAGAAAITNVMATATKVKAFADAVHEKGLIKATAAQLGLNTAMNANIIGLIVAGVVALGVGFVMLYKKCEPFRKFINGIGAGIKKGFLAVVNWFKGLPQVFANIGAKVGMFFTNMGNSIKTGFINVINWVKTVPQKITDGLSALSNLPVIGGFFSSISEAFNNVKSFFSNLIDFVKNVFTGQWTAAWDNVKNIFGSIFGGLAALVKAPINAVIGLVNAAISGINKINFTVPDWIPGVGGKSIGFSIPNIPFLAKGGFTNGLSFAGEAGTEAVISFDPSYRDDNIDTWIKAGRMLGVSQNPSTLLENANNNYSTAASTKVNLGGVTFSPQITIQGNADKQDIIQALENVLPEFYDVLDRWKQQQEVYSF